ncbi:ctf-8, partial [Pristionchus pacificus]
NGLEEWVVLDMQGEINNGGRPFDGEMLGNLGWRHDNSEALFLVGHHLVEGKMVNLERPYLVTAPKDHNGKKVHYVEAVVRRKLVFKLRPKPIVTKHLMKRGEYDKDKEKEQEQEKENEHMES